MPQFSPERGLDPAVAGAIRDETAVNVAIAGDSALGQVVSQAGEWIDSNIKNKAIEARAVSADTRREQMEVRKEGRAGVMDQAERDRQEALYADPESRESKALALETSKTEAEIAKSKAAAGKYGAEAEYARSGKGGKGKDTDTSKWSESKKKKYARINDKYDSLSERIDNSLGAEREALIGQQMKLEQDLINMEMSPEEQEQAQRDRLTALREAKANRGKGTPPTPSKPSPVLGGSQGPSQADMARIARTYAKDKPLSQQEIREIYQAEQLEKAGVNKPTLSPQLYQGGVMGGLPTPSRL